MIGSEKSGDLMVQLSVTLGSGKERKAEAMMAGMDMILCGPTDMTEVKKQLENGTFSIKDLDRL